MGPQHQRKTELNSMKKPLIELKRRRTRRLKRTRRRRRREVLAMTAIRIIPTAAGATEPVHLSKARTFLRACLQLLSTIKEKRSSASLARLAGTAWVTESARALDASPFAVLALSELWKSTPTTIWSATAECERMSTDRSSRCAHGRARSRLIATE